jgi:hypothetical protein
MSGFQKGDKVRKAIPDIVGTIVGAEVDEKCRLVFKVEYTDPAGEVQQRFFAENELVAEPAAEAESTEADASAE